MSWCWVQDCSCGLAGGCVQAVGPGRARVALVGEAPGYEEQQAGVPFVGAAGRELEKLLGLAGLSMAEVWLTNVVMRRPGPGKNRRPTPEEVKACLPRLLAELDRVQPEIVVLLGDTPVHAFFPKIKLSANIGSMLEQDDRKYVVSYHPAAKFYAPRLSKDLEAVFTGLRRFMAEGYGGIQVSSVDPAGPIAIDTETEPDSSGRWRVFCVGTATAGGVAVTPLPAERLNTPRLHVFHNASYDLKMLRSEGVDIAAMPFEDTILLAHLLGLPKGLKQLSFTALGRPLNNLDEILGKGAERVKMAERRDEVEHYCGEDARATLDLWRLLLPRLSAGAEWVYRNIDLPFIPLLVRMEEQGLLVDKPGLEKLRGQLLTAMGRQLRVLEGYGIDSLNKPDQLRRLLEGLGVATRGRTKKKQLMQVDEDNLKELLRREPELEPLLRTVLRGRAAAKLLSTYVEPWLAAPGDRIHPDYNITGTVTGRLSSSHPNGQNIPHPLLRYIMAPPGYVFVEPDAIQLEMMVMAWLSGDPAMLKLLREGHDFHTATAMVLFNTKQPSTQQRYEAKTVNFAMAYGGGPGVIVEKSDGRIGWKQATELRGNYFKRFARLAEWVEQTQRAAWAAKYISNFFGRPRRIYELESRDKQTIEAGLREAINTSVQGTAGDAVKLVMVRAEPEILAAGGRIVAQVHDSFPLLLPEGSPLLPDLAWLLAGELRAALPGEVPFGFEVTVSRRWKGEAIAKWTAR